MQSMDAKLTNFNNNDPNAWSNSRKKNGQNNLVVATRKSVTDSYI